ncbi:hypothetical protein [Saccharothrix australiensis]|uniref:Secreted protein n=1 Tax=Saccharothrix australiensis TaxID=2072 RepID=A0A495VY55_9PSEU|nr:hypothetical protein [Saccharothrix australiensis]RKT54361.1 hypothetical protein C8E97_2981 [Saccharothrix australiensis]
MNTAAKLSAYGAALVLVAGAAWATGGAVGPLPAGTAEGGRGGAHGAEDAGHGDDHGATVAGAEQDQPAGLASSRGGYTLAPTDLTPTPGTPFTFRVLDRDGHAVTAFDVAHDQRMHLIVVRRDTSHYRHLHPGMAADGTWSAPLDVAEGGSYRVFADFKPTGGAATTLGADVSVAGRYEPRGHAPARVAEVDGYRVRLDGDLVPGRASPIRLTVTRDGRPVTDLQPHLAAYGHLVALRRADLAYLHVHPEGAPGDGRTAPGPVLPFTARVPTADTYRLFLDFRHEDVVRTAEFTVEARRGH